MLMIPYQVDVPMARWPVANWLIIGVTCVVSLCILFSSHPRESVLPFVLDGWGLGGMVGHVLAHSGLIHLFGNMIFLFVFGNAVCAKVGNVRFVFIYVVLAFLAAAVHNVFSGTRVIGASGAINGVVGMYLMWYPLNEISCVWWLFIRAGAFSISSYWMILLWFAFDIIGAARGVGRTAYWAHVGGFAAGFVLAWALLAAHWVEMTRTERSLLDIFSRKRGAGAGPMHG